MDEFESKSQCFVDQYNEFDFKVFDLVPTYKGPTAVNGTLTLNENIAGKLTLSSFSKFSITV